jgi:hypothetical protein
MLKAHFVSLGAAVAVGVSGLAVAFFLHNPDHDSPVAPLLVLLLCVPLSMLLAAVTVGTGVIAIRQGHRPAYYGTFVCAAWMLFWAWAAWPRSFPEQDLVWNPESMSATVSLDDRRNQHLVLEQKRPPGAANYWAWWKIDVPDNWTVNDVALRDGVVRIRIRDGKTYNLSPSNIRKLDRAILRDRPKSDAQLTTIWDRWALEDPVRIEPTRATGAAGEGDDDAGVNEETSVE